MTEQNGYSCSDNQHKEDGDPIFIAIAGGGIVGLTLALCLHKTIGAGKTTSSEAAVDTDAASSRGNNNPNNNNVQIVIYEQATQFVDDVGAGMGLYPNGLRVLRDINVLDSLIDVGYPYLYRRFTRHDGTEIAVANELTLLRGQQRPNCTDNNIAEEHKNSAISGNDDYQNSNDSDYCRKSSDYIDEDLLKLQSLGIRRWRLQKVLYDAVQSIGTIPIHFGKRIVNVRSSSNECSERFELTMQDGSTAVADIVFAADGSKSRIREQIVQEKYDLVTKLTKQLHQVDVQQEKSTAVHFLKQRMLATKYSKCTGLYNPKAIMPQLKYCGVTCLMGIAEYDDTTNMMSRGIEFPSSDTSGCHGVFFPTGKDEQCFQFHFPINEENADPDNWGTLKEKVSKQECNELAVRLRAEGWSEVYLKPLEHATNVVRIGFCLLEPETLNQLVYSVHPETEKEGEKHLVHMKGTPRRIVLLGDAAHPLVPYIGQGAQMGLEDAGTLSLLLQHYCLDANRRFSLKNFHQATDLYEKMRIPRTNEILDYGKALGKRQEMRTNKNMRRAGEEQTRRDVFFHGTLPVLFPGARYDYRVAVQEAILHEELEHSPNHPSPKHNHRTMVNNPTKVASSFPWLIEAD